MCVSNRQISIDKIKSELAQVQACVIETLLEIEDIQLRANPAIQAEYAARIGVWILQESNAQLACRKAKRRMQLRKSGSLGTEAQSGVEEVLSREFAECENALRAKARFISDAIQRQGASAGELPECWHEAQSAMRVLVGRLHPILHGDKEREVLYGLAKAAYARCDLHALSFLEESTRGLAGERSQEDNPLVLQASLAIANACASDAHQRLMALRSEEPFACGELLADDAWVERQIDMIRSRIFLLRQMSADCE